MRKQDLLVQVIKKIVQNNGQDHYVIHQTNDWDPIRDEIKWRKDQGYQNQKNFFIGRRDSGILRHILYEFDELLDPVHRENLRVNSGHVQN